MIIPIWILIVLAVLGFLFLTPYREGLIKFFGTIKDLLVGAVGRIWDFLRGRRSAVPAVAGVGANVGMVILGWIMILVLVGILFVAFLYFVIGASIMTVGIITGHWLAAFLLLLALLIWGMLSVLPAWGIFRPIAIVSRWVARPVVIILFVYLIIVVGWWVFGNVSPRLERSVSRSAGNHVEEFSNSLDKSSLKSEPEMGVFAKIIEDSQIYNQAGRPVFFAQKGTLVKVADLDGKKADADSEGKTKVMLPNRHGDFQIGNEGWIPTRKLDWNWQEPAPAPPAEKKAEEKTSAESWEYGFIHPKDGQPRKFPVKSFQRDECSVRIETELFVLNGTSDDGIIYVGKWFQGGQEREGELRNFHFSPNSFCWEGETNQINPNAENWKKITLCKK